MTTLKFMTVDQHLVLQRQPVVASGDKNSVLIQIQLCSMWDGFDVKVAFYKDGNRDFVLDVPLENGECMVPAKMLETPCLLNIGIWGKDAAGRYKTSTLVKYRVLEGTPIEGGVVLTDVSGGTATVDQVLAGATFFAGSEEMQTGAVPTYEEGEPVYMVPYVEADPTVPAWAKSPAKPKYTASEVGARSDTWLPTAKEVGAVLPATVVTNAEVAMQKVVPEDAAPYAEVVEVGGMTRKCSNIWNEKWKTGYHRANSGSYNEVTGEICTAEMISVKPSQKYIVCCSNSVFDNYVLFYDKNRTFISSINYRSGVAFETASNAEYIHVNFGTYGTSYLNNISVVEGTTALPYEPYFEGLRSAPVTEVESAGVNLFGGEALADRVVDLFKGTKNSADKTVSFYSGNANGVLYSGFKANTQYTFMFSVINPDSARSNLAVFYDDGSYKNVIVSTANTKEYVVLVSDRGKTVKSFGGYINSGTTVLDYEKCGIFEGVLTADDFVPYQCHLLSFPEAIRSLPDWGEGISEAFCNRLCREGKRWIYRRCVTRVTFNGTENWKLRTGSSGNTNANYVSLTVGNYGYVEDRMILCDRYEHYPLALTNTVIGITILNSNGYDAGMITCRPWSGITDVTEWKTYLAEQYAAGTPVTVVYGLSAAEVTDITDLFPDPVALTVQPGGTVTIVDEYGYDVPNTVVFRGNANGEVGAVTFFGDLQGTAARAERDAEGKLLASREWVLEQLAALASGGEDA